MAASTMLAAGSSPWSQAMTAQESRQLLNSSTIAFRAVLGLELLEKSGSGEGSPQWRTGTMGLNANAALLQDKVDGVARANAELVAHFLRDDDLSFWADPVSHTIKSNFWLTSGSATTNWNGRLWPLPWGVAASVEAIESTGGSSSTERCGTPSTSGTQDV